MYLDSYPLAMEVRSKLELAKKAKNMLLPVLWNNTISGENNIYKHSGVSPDLFVRTLNDVR